GFGHVVRLREPAAVQPCEAIAHLESGVFDCDGEAVPGAGATECGDVSAGLEHPIAGGNPFTIPPLECCGTFPAIPHISHEACGSLSAESNQVYPECPVGAVSDKADPLRLRNGRQTTCSRACSYALRANKREKGKTFECPVCEVEFTRTPSQIKSKHSAIFCSAACMYKGRTLGLTPRIVEKPYVRVAPINYEAIARAHATRRAR